MLAKLDPEIQEIVRHAVHNPRETQYGLGKLKGKKRSYWSIDICGNDFRAVAEKVDGAYVWEFVGTHGDYTNYVAQL